MKWVVKIGGSLHDSPQLVEVVRRLNDFDAPALVVPGGGPFADQVRVSQKRWGFDDRCAHSMALLGMRQYGCLLASLGGLRASGRIEAPAVGAASQVWLPDEASLDGHLATSWEVTSDSVAAWVAGELGADWLVLVKSVSQGHSHVPGQLVDAAFAGVVSAAGGLCCALVDAGQWLAGDFSCEAYQYTSG